jgi:protein TonB
MSAHGHLSDLLAPRIEQREVAVWSSAMVLVAALHAGGGWWLHSQMQTERRGGEETPAVMLDLAPMVVAPEAVPLDESNLIESNYAEASDEPIEEIDPEPTEAVADKVIEAEEVEPVDQAEIAETVPDNIEPVTPEEITEPVPEEVAEIKPEEVAEIKPEAVAQETEAVIPDLVEAPLPEVAMLVPEPKPTLEEPKPVEKPVRKKTPEPKKKVAAKPKPKQQEAPDLARSAQNAPKAAAPSASKGGTGSSLSPAKWASQVRARIVRASRSTRGTGRVMISFAVSSSGQISSVSVSGSSGDPNLDRAAVSIVRRASPVPAPPPGVSRNVTVPVKFGR